MNAEIVVKMMQAILQERHNRKFAAGRENAINKKLAAKANAEVALIEEVVKAEGIDPKSSVGQSLVIGIIQMAVAKGLAREGSGSGYKSFISEDFDDNF